MLNSQSGWIVGALNFDTFIARTTNGGETWETQYPDPQFLSGFESISIVNRNVGWIVGGSGRVYSTTNGGVVSVHDEVRHLPRESVLRQNYPNPFNPSTKIRFELAGSGFVSLKVFDLLGREVASLINDTKLPGKYSVEFDASLSNGSEVGLPSGVYFYRLSVGGFVETRKMILAMSRTIVEISESSPIDASGFFFFLIPCC